MLVGRHGGEGGRAQGERGEETWGGWAMSVTDASRNQQSGWGLAQGTVVWYEVFFGNSSAVRVSPVPFRRAQQFAEAPRRVQRRPGVHSGETQHAACIRGSLSLRRGGRLRILRLNACPDGCGGARAGRTATPGAPEPPISSSASPPRRASLFRRAIHTAVTVPGVVHRLGADNQTMPPLHFALTRKIQIARTVAFQLKNSSPAALPTHRVSPLLQSILSVRPVDLRRRFGRMPHLTRRPLDGVFHKSRA